MRHTLEVFKKMTGQQVHSNRDLLDELGMLVLPGTDFPKCTNEVQKTRDHAFVVVKRVAVGHDSSPNAVKLVRQLSLLTGHGCRGGCREADERSPFQNSIALCSRGFD